MLVDIKKSGDDKITVTHKTIEDDIETTVKRTFYTSRRSKQLDDLKSEKIKLVQKITDDIKDIDAEIKEISIIKNKNGALNDL